MAIDHDAVGPNNQVEQKATNASHCDPLSTRRIDMPPLLRSGERLC